MESGKSPKELTLVDAKEVARRLGVSPATIRSWRLRKAPWMPEPLGKFEGLVWSETDVDRLVAFMKRDSSETSRKLAKGQQRARGAFYTPKDTANFLATWIVRTTGETYLEPSFGDCVFVEAVNERASSLGFGRPKWFACELSEHVASQANTKRFLKSSEIIVGDFLGINEIGQVDCVVANPPFVRLRNLTTKQSSNAQHVMRKITGAEMASTGSVWLPFLARLIKSVKPGGRMALVLPLEFTYVNYAKHMWRFLANHFGDVRVVRVKARLFPEINQDVLLLLADKCGEVSLSVQFEAFENLSDVSDGKALATAEVTVEKIEQEEKAFQLALLKPALRKLISSSFNGLTEPASRSADFRVGYVSGHKDYFHPSAETVKEFDLPQNSLVSAVSNARKLRAKGLRTSKLPFEATDKLWCPSKDLTAGELSYKAFGEANGVHLGYKCAKRPEWYRVPGVKAPEAIATVFSELPLVLLNDASFVASNSLLGIYVSRGSVEEFVARWYSSLTRLSILLNVHSLGGGVLVMVPNEAKLIEMPKAASPISIDSIEEKLTSGDIRSVYAMQDKWLEKEIGKNALKLVHEGIETLNSWRAR